MPVQIASAAAALIVSEAEKAAPQEACGLLLGRAARRIDEARPAANLHATPDTHFEVDPRALFAALRGERSGGATLLGYYHSHPSGRAEPSAEDARRAAPDGAIWIICASGALRAFLAVGTGKSDRFRPVTLEII